VRSVEVTQVEGKGICFTCTCSFKLPDEDVLHVQRRGDLREKYKSVLQGVEPEQLKGAQRFGDPR